MSGVDWCSFALGAVLGGPCFGLVARAAEWLAERAFPVADCWEDPEGDDDEDDEGAP